MSLVEIRPVKSKSDLREFIFLPSKIYHTRKNWVPPLYVDEWKFYDPKENTSLAHCETIQFLAYQENVCVGRIMGIIPHPYNRLKNERTARFFQLECIQDPQVSHALIEAVECWSKQKAANILIGPFGFSDKDPQGLQVEGFEYLPVIATPTNPPYMEELVIKEGFSKLLDCISYKLPIPEPIPAFYTQIYERALRNNNVRMIEFKKRSELKPYIVPVFRLINETYKDLFGFVPLEEAEMFEMAKKYLPILNPAFVKVILNDKNEPIAFVIAMPDMSKGIQKAKGKLFPFGFIHILSSAKKTEQLDLLLGAVKEEYQGRGLTSILGIKLMETAKKYGLTYMDSHLVLESNLKMRAEVERLGAKIYKRYRVFMKTI
ncbi:MAG TPA: hypothetical protein PKK99_01335 [Bacteroidia bacterium]|nr:hypothetical protein [Bacteroidia bacterium]HNP97663.1 hypothetical protein [Bacteroidia bacterium]